MDPLLFQEGIAYAEQNLGENSHLWLDKKILKENFHLQNRQVLDFGCGMGNMSIWMAMEMGCQVDGFDIDENHIEVCRAMQKKYPCDVRFELRNIINDPVDRQYDLILLNDVIEHLNPEWIPGILTTLVRINLKDGGVLFISYPPWEGPQASHMQRAIRIPWLQYFPERWVIRKIARNNRQTVGRFDLLEEYLALNHMCPKMLEGYLRDLPIRKIIRRSYTKLNRLPLLGQINFNFFPAKFLVTKEFLVMVKSLV